MQVSARILLGLIVLLLVSSCRLRPRHEEGAAVTGMQPSPTVPQTAIEDTPVVDGETAAHHHVPTTDRAAAIDNGQLSPTEPTIPDNLNRDQKIGQEIGHNVGHGVDNSARTHVQSALATTDSPTDRIFRLRNTVLTLRAPPLSAKAARMANRRFRPGEPVYSSGVLIHRDGYALTCDMSIAHTETVTASITDNDGNFIEFRAEIVAREPGLDIALLKVPSALPLDFASMGSSATLPAGSQVMALAGLDRKISARFGIITKQNNVDNRADDTSIQSSHLWSDAIIHREACGQPLMNMQGNLVGIAVSRQGNNRNNADIAPGRVLAIDHVQRLLPSLIASMERPRTWLGIRIAPAPIPHGQRTPTHVRDGDVGATSAIGDAQQVPPDDIPGSNRRGALVTEIHPSSPAASAGLQVGDIVTYFDGVLVDHLSLPWMSALTAPNRTVVIDIVRNNKEQRLSMTTALRPPPTPQQ